SPLAVGYAHAIDDHFESAKRHGGRWFDVGAGAAATARSNNAVGRIDEDFARLDVVYVARFASNEQAPVAGGEKRLARIEELLGAANANGVRDESRCAVVRLRCARGSGDGIDPLGELAAPGAHRNSFAGEQRAKVRLEIGHGGDGRTRAFDG